MKVILKSVVASLAVMSLAACSNNDLYDEGVVAANKTAEQQKSYENNFVKTYGAIAPNQSWDFSTNQQRLGTRAGETEIVTKTVEGLNFDVQYKVGREWKGGLWNGYWDNYQELPGLTLFLMGVFFAATYLRKGNVWVLYDRFCNTFLLQAVSFHWCLQCQ